MRCVKKVTPRGIPFVRLGLERIERAPGFDNLLGRLRELRPALLELLARGRGLFGLLLNLFGERRSGGLGFGLGGRFAAGDIQRLGQRRRRVQGKCGQGRQQ